MSIVYDPTLLAPYTSPWLLLRPRGSSSRDLNLMHPTIQIFDVRGNVGCSCEVTNFWKSKKEVKKVVLDDFGWSFLLTKIFVQYFMLHQAKFSCFIHLSTVISNIFFLTELSTKCIPVNPSLEHQCKNIHILDVHSVHIKNILMGGLLER